MLRQLTNNQCIEILAFYLDSLIAKLEFPLLAFCAAQCAVQTNYHSSSSLSRNYCMSQLFSLELKPGSKLSSHQCEFTVSSFWHSQELR